MLAVILEDALISLPPIGDSSKVATQSLKEEVTRSAVGAHTIALRRDRFATLSKEGS